MSSNTTILAPKKVNFCPVTPYDGFVEGLLLEFNNAIFFSNFIQFAIITFMYINVGKGRYWKTLLYASIAGLLAHLFQSGSLVYYCTKGNIKFGRSIIPTFLISEVFRIVLDFSVPFLNLIKIKIFANGVCSVKIIKNTIIILGAIYSGARLYIGYERTMNFTLSNTNIKYGLMISNSILSLTCLLCIFCILHIVNKKNKKESPKGYNGRNDFNNYITHSNYSAILFVDVLNIAYAIVKRIDSIYNISLITSLVTPFHSLKNTMILILACDALISLYKMNSNNISYSMNNNIDYGNNNNNNNNNNNKNNNNYEEKDVNNLNPKYRLSNYNSSVHLMNDIDTELNLSTLDRDNNSITTLSPYPSTPSPYNSNSSPYPTTPTPYPTTPTHYSNSHTNSYSSFNLSTYRNIESNNIFMQKNYKNHYKN